MQISYRGYEIKVVREECLGGWPMLYYYVMRESDGWFALDDFEDSDEKVRDKIRQFKERIDAELAADDPWGEKAEIQEREQAGWYCVPGGWSSVPSSVEEPPFFVHEQINLVDSVQLIGDAAVLNPRSSSSHSFAADLEAARRSRAGTKA